MIRTILVTVILLVAPAVFAQTTQPAVPTAVEILVLPAVGDPLTVPPIATRSTPISVSSPNCNLAATPPPPGRLTNPTLVEFADPFTVGRVCQAPIPTGLPNGNGYRAVAVPVAPSCGSVTVCRGERSLVAVPSPFDVIPVLVPPTTLTGVGLRQ